MNALMLRFVSVCLLLFLSFSFAEVEELDDAQRVAFSVGNIEITSYVYERELAKLRHSYSDGFDELIWKHWLDGWVDKLRVVGLAEEAGYGANATVLDSVGRTSRYILILGKDGPFQKRVVQPMVEASMPDYAIAGDSERAQARRSVLEEMAEECIESCNLSTHKEGVLCVLLGAKLDVKGDEMTVQQVGGGCGDIALYSFDLDSERVTVSVSAFRATYRDRLVKRRLVSEEVLEREIRSMVVEELFYRKAIDLGIDRDPHFLLEQSNFRNDVMYNVYLETELVGAGEQSAEQYYETHIGTFTVPRVVETWEVGAVSEDVAQEAIKRIKELSISGSLGENSRLSVQESLGVTVTSNWIDLTNREYPEQILGNLMESPEGWVSPLFRKGDSAVFWVKIKVLETRLLSFEEARESVANKMQAERVEDFLKLRMPGLREKYPLIDYGVVDLPGATERNSLSESSP